MSNAISCVTMGPVNGTPQAGDVAAALGGTWFATGTFDPNNYPGGTATDGWLTMSLTNGSFGALPVSGTWAIDPLLWQLHPRAALTLHVGNGGGDPDWFFFEIATGATSGTFDIQKLSGRGGGFSNIVLWADPPGNGPCTDSAACAPAPVPEPASLLLFGTGLAGLALQLRKRYARR